jgi:hypothetical protein
MAHVSRVRAYTHTIYTRIIYPYLEEDVVLGLVRVQHHNLGLVPGILFCEIFNAFLGVVSQ